MRPPWATVGGCDEIGVMIFTFSPDRRVWLYPVGQGLLAGKSQCWKGALIMGIRQSREQGVSTEALRVRPDDPMFTKNPELFECLVGYQGEKKWIPGCKISIWAEMGNIKLCINDDFNYRIGFAVLDTHLKLSQALEEVLDGSGIEWRQKPGKRQ